MRYAILRGTICGPIWQPGIICTKEVSAHIERSDAWAFPHGGPYPSLRNAMLALTGDGDFQACGFVPGSTYLEVVDESAPTIRRRFHEIRFGCWATDDLAAKPEWCEQVYTDDE